MKTSIGNSVLSFIIFAVLLVSCNAEKDPENIQIDREYRLMAYMTGYIGLGGEIEGIRNPLLQAQKGENVRIVMINGETMTHDITMEKAEVQSMSIIDQGDSTSVTFIANEDDTYYCSIPGHRMAGMVGNFKVLDLVSGSKVATGFIPRVDGRKLNFDFEYGSLEDWTYSGSAFRNQPFSDRNPNMREVDTVLNISGEYFLSSGGTENYKDTGTIVSIPFEITHPYASFRVGGGALKETRVELVDAGSDEVFFEITGNNNARLRPVVVDLTDKKGQQMYIRLIDREDGDTKISYVRENIWSHITFDDFRFYAERPVFVDELRPRDIVILPPRDVVMHAGLSGTEAVEAMELPENFTIQLAAAEPDVIRPIAMTMDHRGRLWIAEAHTYPTKMPEGEGKDRILIFEDTNGDGKLNKRIVFMEGLNLISGMEVGLGGVWVGAAPYLLYIPMDEAGDGPAGEPEIVLDGWGYQDTHETLNSLRWGPDGWLYGTHGVFTHSKVGKPGTAEEDRTPFNAGVWRYHPTKKEFEVFAWGTSNPWGWDYNQYGHGFTTVCVIPHLFHVVQGARYHRQSGKHFNPSVYDDIKTIADHVHWVGDNGPHAGNFRSASAGGGHAHAGAVIYQGEDHWPESLRNSIMMNNIHGYRVNVDVLSRKGSGYEALHGKDFVVTNDSWSQWLAYRYGPGGSMFVTDWYDKNQCHSRNPDVHDKTLGRIFKISHDKDEYITIDLSTKTDAELVEYQLHTNEWYVRQSRVLLQGRGGNPQIYSALRKILNENPDVTRKLRALWTMHVTGGLTDDDLLELMDHENEYMRSWALQLLAEDHTLPTEALDKMAVMAKEDESALVRLYISSALQRIAPEDRWNVVAGLTSHKEDFDDHNLPLMNWYAFESLVDLDMERAVTLAMDSEQGLLLHFTIRKMGSMDSDKASELLKKVNMEWKDKYDEHQNHNINEELELLMSSIN